MKRRILLALAILATAIEIALFVYIGIVWLVLT